ncbi:MAG: hypothetical protein ACI4MH_06715 [Candidatus Coproplasma sp.]
MNFKKFLKMLLFPHIAVLIVLLPVSATALTCSMVFLGTKSAVTYLTYALAFYTLVIWCVRVPSIIGFFKKFREDNRYVKRWFDDYRLRLNVMLYGSLVWNTAYAVLQLGLGFWHGSAWFYSLAGYYVCLALTRFFIVSYTKKHTAGEHMREELVRYRICGIILLVMNLALSVMIFFMVYWNKTFHHNEITAITLAAYTFVTFAVAIRNLIKYRRLGSPVYTASKVIGLTAACVSMLTLEATMLTAFDDGSVTLEMRRIMLGVSGAVVSAFIIGLAIYMIVQGGRKLKLLKISEGKQEGEQNGKQHE